jgi:hypothetical protein
MFEIKEELPNGGVARMTNLFKKESQFKTRWYHRMPRYWFQKDLVRPEGVHGAPEVFRLDVAEGVKPNKKPPVRIYLGTEAGQFRAERVFVWSVMKVRDPARVYEIHFMKELKGYDRTGWKTGFTNYRYGIPAMCGGKGRAIYNDVDQLYLADPGEMFDLDMGGAGMLCITPRETSVMLIDCEKMIPHWTLAYAQRGKRHKFFRETVQEKKLWGRLPSEWNARDDEFTADKSKCFHFTTLQTQPWQPFPDVLRYEPHPDGEVWFSRERAADAAGFSVFTKEQPSRRFVEILDQQHALNNRNNTFDKAVEADIKQLMSDSSAKDILSFGLSDKAVGRPILPGLTVAYGKIASAGKRKNKPKKYEGVVCVDLLPGFPDEDVSWMIDELFKSATKFVYASVACDPSNENLANGQNARVTQQLPEWWNGWFSLVARRHPSIRWKLRAVEKGGKSSAYVGDERKVSEAA